MTLKDIIKKEHSKYEHEIYLFKQGTFYRAYGQSEKLFVVYIHPYRLWSKFFKTIDTDLCYIGFPISQWNLIQEKKKPIKIVKDSAKSLLLQLETSIDLEKINKVPIHHKSQQASESYLEKIKSFPIHSKTPTEAYDFFKTIHQQLNHSN